MALEQLQQLIEALRTGRLKVPFNPFASWLPPALWDRQKDVFFYGTEFLPLVASATASNDISIQSDSHFLIMGGVAVVTDTSDATIGSTANAFDKFNPPFLATVIDSGSGRQFSNIAISFRNVFGVGELPFLWPFPKLIRRGSTLTLRLQNLVATDRRIRAAFVGFKIFPGLTENAGFEGG